MEKLLNAAHTAKLWADSIPYMLQFRVLNTISSVTGEPLRNPQHFKKYAPKLLKDLNKAFYEDSRDLHEGLYPLELRKPIEIKKQLSGFKNILFDYPKVLKRKKKKETKVDSNYPDYFSRTFHFQTDGYTSKESADLYDQQVEILFTGSANVMRRLLIKELTPFIDQNSKILEQACGTGISSLMMAKAFKKSHITATDLSHEYLEYANEYNKLNNISYLHSDATYMDNIDDAQFDVVYSVFLHHELPSKQRKLAIEEMIRKLKSGGYGAILDSAQIHDVPHYEDILLEFPKRYHEPFYTNYVKNPLEDILRESGVTIINSSTRFLSKCVVFKKS